MAVTVAVGEIGRVFVIGHGLSAGKPQLDTTSLADISWDDVLPVASSPGSNTGQIYDETLQLGKVSNTADPRVYLLKLRAKVPGSANLTIRFAGAGQSVTCGEIRLKVMPVILPQNQNLTIEAGVWPATQTEDQVSATIRLLQEYGFNAFSRVWRPGDPRTLSRIVAAAAKFRPIKSIRLPVPRMIHNGQPEATFDESAIDNWADESAEEIKSYETAMRPLGIGLAYEIWDEPRPEFADQLLAYVSAMRRRVPGVSLQITAAPESEFVGRIKVDTWIVPISRLRPDILDSGRRAGGQLWLYSNRWHGIDRPANTLRIAGWALWANDLSGYYFWGINRGTADVRGGGKARTFQRDNLVYPIGRSGIAGSVRLEMFQEGLQDYALLRLLGTCRIADGALSADLASIRGMRKLDSLADQDIDSLHGRLLAALVSCK
jgi:hypothetical protein